MAQQKETRLFTGGMDSNTAPFAIEKNDFLNAVNIRAILNEGQRTGLLDAVPGTVYLQHFNNLLPSSNNVYIGSAVDEITDNIYVFLVHNPSIMTYLGFIIKFESRTSLASIFIDEANVVGGFGWFDNTIISARIVDGILIFADGYNDIRYLDLSINYFTGGGITQADLSMIPEPPAIPLTHVRNAVAGSASSIQNKTVQFAWRFVLTRGFQSVLSPLSTASYAATLAAIQNNPLAGISITITANTAQKVPTNWKFVEFIVKYPDTNAAYVIRRWQSTVAADVAAVNAHNQISSAVPLSVVDWRGLNMEALSADEITKAADASPMAPNAIEVAANRLFTGGGHEGYDSPKDGFTIGGNGGGYTLVAPTNFQWPVYMVWVKEAGSSDHHFAIVVNDGVDNYVLPKECGSGSFTIPGGAGAFIPNPQPPTTGIGGPENFVLTMNTPVFTIPQRIHRSHLIKLNESRDFIHDATGSNTAFGPANLYGSPHDDFLREVRKSIVLEANGLGGFQDQHSSSGTEDHWLVRYGQILIEDDAPSSSATGQYRAFVPAIYKTGVRFYDNAMRTAGSTAAGQITIPKQTSFLQFYYEWMDLSITAATPQSIPPWAKYYSLLLSKNQRTTKLIQFVTGIVKVAVLENGGIVYRGWDEYSVSNPTKSVHGIAFPINALATGDYGYVYAAGDTLEYWYMNGSTFVTDELIIREVADGYVICYDTSVGHTKILNLLSQYLDVVNLHWNNTIPSPGDWFLNIEILEANDHPQPKCMVKIMSGGQPDGELYEVAAFGRVLGTNNRSFGPFFSTGTNTARIYGDTFLQARTGISGAATAQAIAPQERNSLVWITDAGRIAPADSIGQQSLSSGIRWSNAAIPGAQINGMASFDANDLRFVDGQAGKITALQLTTMGQQDGGQMLVICIRGSFTGLVGQRRLTDGAGQAGIIVSSDEVIDRFNPIAGGFGSSSYMSVVRYQHHVWWADTYNRKFIEFNSSGAGVVSDFKFSDAMDEYLFKAEFYQQPWRVSCGVNPHTREVYLSIPNEIVQQQKILDTTSLPYPFTANILADASLGFNWENNRWTHRYDSGANFMRAGSRVFSWHRDSGKFYEEFAPESFPTHGVPGQYYGQAKAAYIAVVFNSPYPAITSPSSLHVVSERAPDQCWIMSLNGSKQHVAGVGAWEPREQGFTAAIRKDRTTGGGTLPADWSLAGITGKSLKGNFFYVVMQWSPGAPINLSSATMAFIPSAAVAK